MKDAEVIEAMARAMCAADGAIWEAANFNETDNGSDPEDQREYWRDKAQTAFTICAPAIRERCAVQAWKTGLESYMHQPWANDSRQVGAQAAADIRALLLPTPHDGLTDTSHHAGSSAGASGQWNQDVEAAPKDGTMLQLLVKFTDQALEDNDDPQVTIGANNGKHDGNDHWKFAGWNWEQDCFTEGAGRVLAWMPLPGLFISPPAPSGGEMVLVPRELLDRFPEINPSNYEHDDACALNSWGCEVVTAASPAPPHQGGSQE